jgi:hypothetical protein
MAFNLTREDARRAARGLAMGRVALGISAVVVPRVPARPWVGLDADRPPAKMLARALGGRDIALGVGALLALNHDAPVRGWLEAGGLADAGDVFATIIGWRGAAPWGRWLVVAAASGGVVAARILSPTVD